jgi:hypothetical protein
VPYGAAVQTSPDAVRRIPPVAALLATPLALLTALVVGFFSLIALAFSNGEFGGGGWLVVLTPAVLALALLVGVVLLLLGRSWLALAVPAGALAAVLLAAEVLGSWSTGLVGPLGSLVPGGAAVLAALPGVRHWIAARREARRR